MKKLLFFLLLCSNLFANEYETGIDEVPKIDEEQRFLINENFRKTKESLKKKVENLADMSVDSTATEIDQALDGIGAAVTAANLTTLTDGSNADSLHVHSFVELELTPDFDSGWTTATDNTLITKAHGLTLTFPDDPVFILIWWRASSGGSYLVPVNWTVDTTSGDGAGCSYDATNIYLENTNRWARYVDSAGSKQSADNGQIRVFAWDLI